MQRGREGTSRIEIQGEKKGIILCHIHSPLRGEERGKREKWSVCVFSQYLVPSNCSWVAQPPCSRRISPLLH